MANLDDKWKVSRANERSAGITERIAALKVWMELAIRSETDQPSEQTIAHVDEIWSLIISQLSDAFKREAQPFQGVPRLAWLEARDLCRLRITLLARQFGPPPSPSKLSFFRKASKPRNYSASAALIILREAYATYCQAYHVPPRGFWLLAHTLFFRCLNGERNEIPIDFPDPLPPGVEVYRQILIYGLANPYALRCGHFAVAAQILDFYARLGRFLTSAPAQDGARGLVVVSLDTDAMPRTIARAEPSQFNASYLYIQLHDLTYEMQLAAEGVGRGGNLPFAVRGDVEITRRETAEVINATLRAFAGVAARAIPRVPANGPIEIVCGFYPAWSELICVAQKQPASGAARTAVVVNQTITGVAFTFEGTADIQLRVGDIILFRRPGQPMWRIGVIRWLEVNSDTEVLVVGAQAIGLRSDAYTATDANGLDVPIIVAQVPNHVGDTTVLLPDHGVGTDAQLSTREGDQSASIVLTDLRETHVDCARYQFLTV